MSVTFSNLRDVSSFDEHSFFFFFKSKCRTAVVTFAVLNGARLRWKLFSVRPDSWRKISDALPHTVSSFSPQKKIVEALCAGVKELQTSLNHHQTHHEPLHGPKPFDFLVLNCVFFHEILTTFIVWLFLRIKT